MTGVSSPIHAPPPKGHDIGSHWPWVVAAALLLLLRFGLVGFSYLNESEATTDDVADPMRLQIVEDRTVNGPTLCRPWIAASGDIVPGTARAFAAILKTMGTRPLDVYIDSPGGNVAEALAMGRMIRERRLGIGVSRTIIDPCDGDVACGPILPSSGRLEADGAICASACVLILAGGLVRAASPDALIGVHQTSWSKFIEPLRWRIFADCLNGSSVVDCAFSTPERRVVDRGPSQSYAAIGTYLTGMGISPALLPMMMATPSEGIHWLTPAERQETAIVTTTVWPGRACRRPLAVGS